MDGLPFTVAYGQAIWIATLALGPLAGVWWLLRRRSARSRSAHRLERRAFQPARTSVEGVADGELVCLEGRLASRGAPAARLEDGAPCAATTIGPATGEPWAGARAEELVLRVAGVEVELEGPIRVARGTREAWPDSPLKQLDAPLLARASTLDGGAAVLAQLGDRRVAIRSLAHGARVRVRGALVRKSAVEGGRAYRHSAHRVALAAPRGSALSAQAVASPTLALPPLLALGAGALLGLFAWIALCIGAGALSAGVIHAERAAPLEHPRAEASSALVAAGLIGAATPSARALALETLAGAWSAGGPPSEERADVAIELAGLRGCAARVQALMRHQRFEEALAVAESCPEPEARLLAMHTAWLLGDFERVVDERRRFAAQAWRAEVPELGLGQDRTGIARLLIGDREQASLELDAPDGECVLGAIRGFGARGGAAACVLARAARLEGPARRAHLEPLLSEGSLSCVGPRLGRPARLASCPPGMEASGGVAVALYLGALDGFRGDEAHELVGERTVPWSPRSLLSDCPIDPGSAPGLEQAALEHLRALDAPSPFAIEARAHLAAALALAYAWIHPQRSLQLAREARAQLERLLDPHERLPQGFDALPRWLADAELLVRALERLAEGDLAGVEVLFEGSSPPIEMDLGAAGTRSRLWTERSDGGGALALAFHRAPPATQSFLRNWIAHGDPETSLDGTRRQMFCQAARRSLAARAAGLPGLAARWHEAAERHHAALMRTSDAVALALLEERGIRP